MSTIDEIASKHLGRTRGGELAQPYVTPDKIDPSLLVGVPRSLNRVQYGIDDSNLDFIGVDVWNAYEFSTLLKNGFPISGWLKFAYSSYSPNIVESKSVKLYLNSYNMVEIIDSLDDIDVVEEMISRDLSKVVKSDVIVSIHMEVSSTTIPVSIDHYISGKGLVELMQLESYCNVEEMVFRNYNEDPDILVVVDNYERIPQYWTSYSLRSNCRVTNQPDWGDVFIYIDGDKVVDPESLLQYIISMRKENHFHEEIAECIYTRLHNLLQPNNLVVGCLYSRRGGVDINPIRSSNAKLMHELFPIISVDAPHVKTSKQ